MLIPHYIIHPLTCFKGISALQSVEWQSLTFVGERHQLELRIAGHDASALAERITAGLAEAEFAISRNIVADIACTREPEPGSDGSITLCIEALTIEDSLTEGPAKLCEGFVKRLRRVWMRCAPRVRRVEVAIDPCPKLTRRRHRRGVEQPHHARVRTELCQNVVEQQLGRWFGRFERKPVGVR